MEGLFILKPTYSKGKGRFKSSCGWFEQLDEEFGVWKGKRREYFL